MDKEQTLNQFWNGFGLKAYDENSVPDDTPYPYITYSVATGSFEDVVALTANLYYKSTSWAAITKKKDEIATAIGRGGICVKIDGGRLWLTRGQTFAQRLSEDDDTIRRYYLQIQAEYMTND